MNQAVPPEQLPTCEVCQLQPAPSSVQHTPFYFAEVLLLFYSLKLAAASFLLSYCFAKNVWYCPQCRRPVEIPFEVPGSQDNLVLRFGNCVLMLTRTRFRVIAGILIAVLVYSFATSLTSAHNHAPVEKTWTNLANNCGYEAFLQNQLRANLIYREYPGLGEWTLSGIFLREQTLADNQTTRLHIKMSPTQFKNSQTEDIVVYQTRRKQGRPPFVTGEVLKFTGQWEGREQSGHLLRFVAVSVQATGNTSSLEGIPLLQKAKQFIRIHQIEKQNDSGLTKN